MYRISIVNGKWFSVFFPEEDNSVWNDVLNLVEDGIPTLIVDSIEEAKELLGCEIEEA